MNEVRLSKLLLCALMTFSCVHSTFPYSEQKTDRYDPNGQHSGESRQVSSEAEGVLWRDCSDLNDEAIRKVVDQLKSGEKIVGIEWLDYKTNSFKNVPSCLKETGWAWAIYTFWWPTAAKVQIRARITSVNTPDQNAKTGAAGGPTMPISEQDKNQNKIPETKNLPDMRAPLELVGYSTEVTTNEYDQHFVHLNLELKNNGRKRVSAYKIEIDATTKLGNHIGRLTLTSESSSISPLETAKDTFVWKDNQFRDGETYDKLSAVSRENLIIKMVNQTVVKSD